MTQPLRTHEDVPGVTHGVFGSGVRLSNQRLANAYAEAQEQKNKTHDGKHWLKVSVPAGLVGIAIGMGLCLSITLITNWNWLPSYLIGAIGGFGLGIATTLIVPRIPKWCKHCWHSCQSEK